MQETQILTRTGTVLLVFFINQRPTLKQLSQVTIEFPLDQLPVVRDLKPTMELKVWKNSELLVNDAFFKLAVDDNSGSYAIPVSANLKPTDEVSVWLCFSKAPIVPNNINVRVTLS